MKKIFLFVLLSIFNLKPCDSQSLDTFTTATMEFDEFMTYELPGYDFQINNIIKEAKKKLTNQQFKFLLSNFLAKAFLKGDFLIVELLIAYEELQITTGHLTILHSKYYDKEQEATKIFDLISTKIYDSELLHTSPSEVRNWALRLVNRRHPKLGPYYDDELEKYYKSKSARKQLPARPQPIKISRSAPADLVTPRGCDYDEKKEEDN